MMKLNLLILFLLIGNFILSQDTVTINIDFGSQSAPLPWNNMADITDGNRSNLLESNGTATDIGIEVYDAFNGINTSGTTNADPALNIPSEVSGDSFYGNAIEFAGGTQPTGGVTITGLDPAKLYDLTIFGSRLATDNRETQYNIYSGQADTSLYLNVADNTSEFVTVQKWQPKPDGSIQIEATTGPNNDNTYGFYYLGMLRIQYEGSIVLPQPALALTAPTGGEYWQPGKQPSIRWNSQGITEVNLEYSTNGGMTWNLIATTSAFSQNYNWTIPNIPSEDCLVRITADTLTDQSDATFQIADESSSQCHIAVLGSSTAAGTGPTSVDSAWVWMYRDLLFQNDTRFMVTNLAKGGFTTYNILPTDATIPAGINQSIDTARNVTKALSLNPDAIIINLPSNDAANSYSVNDQLNNYDQILAPVISDSIPHWICTPQPRNGFSMTQVQIQNELRDSTFLRFGDFAIDFWNTIATSEGSIHSNYDSGDGVHLNNQGHQILLERVLGARVDSVLLVLKNDPVITSLQNKASELNFYPNPSNGKIFVKDLNPPFDLEIYNSQGQLVTSVTSHSSVNIELEFRGLQYLCLKKDGRLYGAWIMNR